MENTRNIKEIELLRNDPKALIVSYQPVIRFIVQRYIYSGFIQIHDKEDFVQHTNEELLNRIEKIQKQYNGKAQIRTYISVIIRNICIELLNKKKKNPEEITETESIEKGSEDTLSGIIIEQEIDRFQKILMLFHKQKARLELCLKILYRISVKKADMEAFYPGLKDNEYSEVLKSIDPKENHTDKELYQIITPFLNQCEKKDNTSDAIRKWTNMKIDEMITLMNGTPKRANYNKETLQILVEKYYSIEKK
ncbi:sigma-70 family RNA polymerase sigma factor [candidate division KSB1 bacterium]